MRPLAGDDVSSTRPRNGSFGDNPTPIARQQPPPMSFFLADEKYMEASLDRSISNSSASHRRHDHMKRSNYGVESLETISSLSQDSDDQDSPTKARNTWKQGLVDSRKSYEDMASSYSPSMKSSADVSRNMSPSESRRRHSPNAAPSLPITPSFLESPILRPTSSEQLSRLNSEIDFLTDDGASQAILSSGDEERSHSPDVMEGSSNSQLVMPSIQMPSRRPFTEKGKSMGRLKILIAGDSGVGKTSLIKAIVQSCSDIVHVDPLTSIPLTASETLRRKSRRKSKSDSLNTHSTTKITEVFASTRAYPSWWSESEDSKILRRRRSMGDTVLERNICFVDTPGYSNGTSCMECITPVMEYIHSQYERTASAGISDGELICMLSGGGGSQVDVVFYVIHKKAKAVDIEYLRRLSQLTNVIPLIAQADNLSKDQLDDVKAQVLSELQSANLRPLNLNISENGMPKSDSLAPYAVSSLPSNDDETMDASLLMSPDYVQPLVQTELSDLVSQVFSPDAISYLRHHAALKCVRWRKSPESNTSSIPRSVSLGAPFQTTAVFGRNTQIATPPIGATNTYALARIADHTQREERLAQVRLSKWASDLQRSLANERARFEALARGERAVWLTERLGECVQDGTLVPVSQIHGQGYSVQSGGLARQEGYTRQFDALQGKTASALDRNDPLGLLQLNAELRRRTWATVQIVSGFGAIGALAFWLARSWHAEEGWGVGFNWGGLIVDW